MTNLDDTQLDAVSGGFSVRGLYREGVNGITAVAGGWKLANSMYGQDGHGASWAEKKRAMGAMKHFLDGGDRLPSWAPNW